MIFYDKFDVSEGIDANKASQSSNICRIFK